MKTAFCIIQHDQKISIDKKLNLIFVQHIKNVGIKALASIPLVQGKRRWRL
jgi:hypothetical protein